MSNYKTSEKGFDRILLFKPQRKMTYIRKLSMSYGYYVALAVVNKNDYVTHIGVENNFQIIRFKDLITENKNILGEKKCETLQPDDLMSMYSINKALKLTRPYRLDMPCRGMRYTNPGETYYLKKQIIDTLTNTGNKPGIVDDYGNLREIYSEKTEFDLDNVTLENELLDLDLPFFNSLNATGQTKLI